MQWDQTIISCSLLLQNADSLILEKRWTGKGEALGLTLPSFILAQGLWAMVGDTVCGQKQPLQPMLQKTLQRCYTSLFIFNALLITDSNDQMPKIRFSLRVGSPPLAGCSGRARRGMPATCPATCPATGATGATWATAAPLPGAARTRCSRSPSRLFSRSPTPASW